MWETTLQFEQRALTMMRTGRATRKNRDMSYENLMRRFGVRP